ncbi:MAG: hypothetical protein HDT26_10620 [Subdoligranulum sp.]|nr:hypothetical protein [Subdoligranulum sp.]
MKEPKKATTYEEQVRIFSAVPAGLGLQTAAERRSWGAVLAFSRSI